MPVTLMSMVPMHAPAWQKSTCFTSLRDQAYQLACADHNIADVINFIVDKLPTSTSSALQEAQRVATDFILHVTRVENLHPLTFLDHKEAEDSVDISQQKDKRLENVSFVRF